MYVLLYYYIIIQWKLWVRDKGRLDKVQSASSGRTEERHEQSEERKRRWKTESAGTATRPFILALDFPECCGDVKRSPETRHCTVIYITRWPRKFLESLRRFVIVSRWPFRFRFSFSQDDTLATLIFQRLLLRRHQNSFPRKMIRLDRQLVGFALSLESLAYRVGHDPWNMTHP